MKISTEDYNKLRNKVLRRIKSMKGLSDELGIDIPLIKTPKALKEIKATSKKPHITVMGEVYKMEKFLKSPFSTRESALQYWFDKADRFNIPHYPEAGKRIRVAAGMSVLYNRFKEQASKLNMPYEYYYAYFMSTIKPTTLQDVFDKNGNLDTDKMDEWISKVLQVPNLVDEAEKIYLKANGVL